MRANHPNLNTLNSRIEDIIPGELIHGKVHLLWASPSCVHHSRARGGKPRNDQQRSQPEHVTTWITQCDVDNIIIENVPEIMDWGPLDDEGQPIKEKKGMYFKAWVNNIRNLGYNLTYRILCCADYGDATTRKRFFMMASKIGLPEPEFPKPTFGNNVPGLKQWRGVRECLELDDIGTSIFNRKKPLAMNTMRRIAYGMSKYNGMDFLIDMFGAGESDESRVKQLELPLPTQHAGGNRFGIVRPFIVKLRNNEKTDEIDNPISTITAGGGHHMLCQPLVVDHLGGGKAHPLNDPIGTQATHDRYSLLTPVVIGQQSGSAARPVSDPCPTIAVKGAVRVATPIIINSSRPGAVKNDPICTLTSCDGMQVGLPMLEDGRLIDIRIRMLKPSELAAAHSFPKGYVLKGNRCDQIKQVGNSVPVNTAAALCEQMLRQYVKKETRRKKCSRS